MNLEQQLEGMVTLGMPAHSSSQVLALFSGSGIVLYHVAVEGEQLYITLELDDFRRAQRLLRDQHIRFRICGKQGVPFFISRCKRRKGIWAALLCTVVLMHWMLSFLWTYEVIGNELSDDNVMYTVHFYAGTHKDALRNKLRKALDANVPVYISECSIVEAPGNGAADYESAEEWLKLINEYGLSYNSVDSLLSKLLGISPRLAA